MPTTNRPDDLEVETADALAQLRIRLKQIKGRWLPFWKSKARQRELQLAVNVYVDGILMGRLRAILDSAAPIREFDAQAFVDGVLDEAKTLAADPDVERLAGSHRDKVVAAARAIFLQELGRSVSVSDLPRGANADDAFDAASEAQSEHDPGTDGSRLETEDLKPEPTAEPVLKAVALPSLPREALKRIETAEREAKTRYHEDKIPYFPLHPDFSFLEESIYQSMQRILEYLRILAQDLLDAHLKEYLEYSPAALFNYQGLLGALARSVGTVIDQLWQGYGYTLQFEPTSRRARLDIAMATGTIDEKPELEPLRYPPKEQWADFLMRMAEPDSEMSRLNAQYEATMLKVLQSRIEYYQQEALSRNPDLREKLRRTKTNNAADGSSCESVAPEETLTWEDIEIRFLSDERVEIIKKGHREYRNYAEFGFEDRRVGKPNLAWWTLVLMAKSGGEINRKLTVQHKRAKVEKRVQNIRSILRGQFQIEDDPIPLNPEIGYQARFKVTYSSAAET